MCWIGVLWPQVIWSRVRPNTAATLSRSAGLGVQRPSTMASTRCSSSPDRSASCLWSIPCSRQSSSTLLLASITTPPAGEKSPGLAPSRRAAELRPVAVQVFHRDAVPPEDLVRGDAEGRRHALPLLGAGGVAALDDGGEDFPVQPAGRQHPLQ